MGNVDDLCFFPFTDHTDRYYSTIRTAKNSVLNHPCRANRHESSYICHIQNTKISFYTNMNDRELLKKRVAQYYWQEDLNCATTTLKILSESFNIELNEQVFYAATGMHGAGLYGAQCGLVEGTLMFLGIFAQHNNYPKDLAVTCCYEFARAFENVFSSLQCSVLRPEGLQQPTLSPL